MDAACRRLLTFDPDMALSLHYRIPHFSNRFIPLLIVLGFALSLAGCQAVLPDNKTKENDVAIFIQGIKKTAATEGLEKTTASEGRKETVTLLTPNLDHEFSFFSKAILTESFLKGYYTTTTRQQEGLFVTTYIAIGDKPEVRLLEVFRNAGGQIEGLRMETEQDNYLFQNSLKGELVAGMVGGAPAFKNYRLEGKQKMLFGNPYQFDISAKAL
jgi:hypothetical protein